MAYIVKGLRKPKACQYWHRGGVKRCILLDDDDSCKAQTKKTSDDGWDEQFASCPIIAIPYDHGEIVDARTGKQFLEAEHDTFSKRKDWEY